MNKPQDVCNDVLRTDETDVERFGRNAQHHDWRKPAHKLRPIVEHDGAGAMIGAFFWAATGPGHVVVIEPSTNSFVYQSIPKSNVRPSV